MDHNTHKTPFRIFLCHGVEDKSKIREIYTKLRENGAFPWLDEENLIAGQNWNDEIKKAVKQSHVILVCLSSKSVRKEGYIQKEIRFALDIAEEKPEGTIFIIPVKLDDCELPERLRKWQSVNYYDKDGYSRIRHALNIRSIDCGLGEFPIDSSNTKNFPKKLLFLIGFIVLIFSLFLAFNTYRSQNIAANIKWDTYVEQFLTDYFAANPTNAVYQGRHEFDGKLPDWSEDGLKKEIARLKNEREIASAFKDEQLDERQQFERDYVIAQIDKDLFWRETADQPHTSPYYYADSLDPDVYISRPYAPLETRIKAYTAYARAVPGALEQIKGNLKMPMAKNLIKIGRQTIGGLAEFYETTVIEIFAPVKDEALQKDFKEANWAAAGAVKDFDEWLEEKEATANDNFALGAEKFSQMLKQTEGVDIPLDKLEEIAGTDLQYNLDLLEEECHEYAQQKTLQECIEKASAHKAAGTDILDATRRQLKDLRKFVREKDLVTLPPTEIAKVDRAPSYKSWNFAFINIRGPYEIPIPSIYYVAPPDPTWPKEKQNAYIPGKGSLLSTSVHEGYPGHFVQFLHANQAKSKFGQVFVGYAYAEGWAHYTEEMMFDAGLGENDPEIHIGQLQEALLRNVRFVSAIGLHTKGMTVEASKKMFIEKGMQDEGNAEQQANRGTFDPAYLNYTMGRLMIRKLRDDWCATRGGRGAWKQFHDQFLSYGGPPIPQVRKAMMGKDDKGSLF